MKMLLTRMKNRNAGHLNESVCHEVGSSLSKKELKKLLETHSVKIRKLSL